MTWWTIGIGVVLLLLAAAGLRWLARIWPEQAS